MAVRKPETPEECLREYHACIDSGTSHLAVMQWVSLWLLNSSSLRDAEPPRDNTILVPFTRPHTIRAFLACYTDPTAVVVVPLKLGLNRVGRGTMWGDHDWEEAPRLIEERQWIIVVRLEEALAADDHSTNGSVWLPQDSELPARLTAPFPLSQVPADTDKGRQLEWSGDTVVAMQSGDVLVSNYASFVFGKLDHPVDTFAGS